MDAFMYFLENTSNIKELLQGIICFWFIFVVPAMLVLLAVVVFAVSGINQRQLLNDKGL